MAAVSRLVVSEEQQRNNQLLFKQAMSSLDTALLGQYLKTLQIPNLDWQSGTDKQYALPWVVAQPWASIERNTVLTCDQSICASIIRAPSNAAKKLDIACKRTPEMQPYFIVRASAICFPKTPLQSRLDLVAGNQRDFYGPLFPLSKQSVHINYRASSGIG